MTDVAVEPSCSPHAILPRPRSLVTEAGILELGASTPLLCEPGTEKAGELLARRLRDGLGWSGSAEQVPPGHRAADPVVRLRLRRDADGPSARPDVAVPAAPDAAPTAPDLVPEAYALTVDAHGVLISGDCARGVLHGVRTLLQLLPARVLADDGAAWHQPGSDGVVARLPYLRIQDAPRLSYRGLMLDVARSFLDVDEVCALAEAAGLVKINVLHLHLADDQGWRLEITNAGRRADDRIDYTALTRVSGSTAVTAGGYTGRPGRTGWYSQCDYRRILAFCRSRGIEVVPEIDVPGHVGAALHALPELCTSGASHAGTADEPVPPADGSTAVGRSYLDPHAPATRRFLRHVLGQVAALDPQGRRIHLGGDEPWAMAERYGAGEGSAYAELLRYAQTVVRELGREPVGWNEAVSAGPRGGLLQLWHVEDQDREALVRAAQVGARFIMSPASRAYLDQKYDPASPIGLTWAGIVGVAQARDWDPEEVLPGVGRASIVGVEAPLWSETVRGRRDAEWLVFPRLLAIAEVGWCDAVEPDGRAQELAGFLTRCAAYGPRLSASGTGFHVAAEVPWANHGAADGVGLPQTP